MSNLADYFSKNRYLPKYKIGDRVRGIWNGIPFTGDVAIDTMVDEYEGPYVIVFSDLPIRDESETVYNIIKCKHYDIETLKNDSNS